MSHKFYIARVSLHCKDTDVLKVRTRVSASAPTSRQLAQRNACDPGLSKSCNGVKGVSRVSHPPMHDRYADVRRARKLHAHLCCRTTVSETRTMRIKRTADMPHAMSRAAAGSTIRFQKFRQSFGW